MGTKPHTEAFRFCAIVVGFIFLAGCKRENVVTAISSTNIQLQADLDRIARLPLEHDPAKRPLILSEPAANRRQWAIQTLKQAYQQTGRTNVSWDAKVETAFEAFVDYSRVSTTNWATLEEALAALASTGCDDPMIQYMRVRYHSAVQPEDQKALQFIQAHDAILPSQYHPVFKFFAGLRAVDSARAADPNSNRGWRLERITVDLEDLARDTNAPVDEVFDAAFLWLEHSSTKQWIQFVTSDLNRILEQNWSGREQWFRFQGEVEVSLAWAERGGGWANTVTEKGWKGFADHMSKAEQFLEQAWQINSSNAQTAYLMMRVELGQGKGRSRMETWFKRAMALQPAHDDAVKLMAFYLEPRWYGSEEKALSFARSCVASDKWRGQVPLVLANLHRSLANYAQMSNSPAYWHQPHVWRDVKSSYEKFFALNPDAAGWRHNYAKDAYDCGQYAVFLEQTKLFAYGTNYAFFGGKEQLQEMLKTAAAASPEQEP